MEFSDIEFQNYSVFLLYSYTYEYLKIYFSIFMHIKTILIY